MYFNRQAKQAKSFICDRILKFNITFKLLLLILKPKSNFMEQDQNTSLFGLGIDTNSKAHLSEAARWAKFLAIVGFVVCGLVLVVGIFAGSIFSSMTRGFRDSGFGDMPMGSGFGTMMAVIYIGIALLYFFPCLFLFRFATLMKTAIATDEQQTLNTSFQNLKKMFRFVGILTIIILSFYVLVLLVAIIGGVSMGGF